MERQATTCGQLAVVPTPIGNLRDITLRALDVLGEADLILAEDTRTSSVLLRHYDIKCPLESHHKFNEYHTAKRVAERIASENLKVALISDAGTPLISDPGSFLLEACLAEGVTVTALPGATALVPALVLAALPTESFVFEGFLPQKKGRKTKIEQLATETRTIVLYESPYRVLKTLRELASAFGEERPAATVRELTKVHETVERGTLGELVAHYSEVEPRGEFVLVVHGDSTSAKAKKNKQKQKEKEQIDNDSEIL